MLSKGDSNKKRVRMKEGYYWVRDKDNPPEVWRYIRQFGWYRPCVAVPITLSSFKLMNYQVISDRLLPPGYFPL